MKAKLSLLTVALSSLIFTPISSYAASASADENAALKQEVKLLKQQTALLTQRENALEARIKLDDEQHQKEQAKTRAVITQIAQRQQIPLPATVNSKASTSTPVVKQFTSNWLEAGDALYIQHNYPYFYDVVTLNSPKSTANNNICINGMLCISADMNLDLRYVERSGDIFVPGSVIGVGVRPLFAYRQQQWLGSVNNVDIFLDAAVNKWVSAHIDLAYLNGSQNGRLYAHNESDYATVYNSAAGLKVNQAYALLANPAVMPFFVQVGKVYSNFGNYDPYPILPTLTQLLEQSRTGGVIAGAIFPNGFFGTASWTMAQQSMENLGAAGLVIPGTERDRNYGAQIGFRKTVCNVAINANASYTADIRDSDYLTGGANLYNNDFPAAYYNLTAGQAILMNRAPAVALHADVKVNRFGLGWDYVSALRSLNPDDPNHSQVSAWGVDGNVAFAFPILNYPSTFDVSYQHARNSNVYQRVESFPPAIAFAPGNVLPSYRIATTLSALVLPNITVSAQFVDDKDSPPNEGGTGKWSYEGIARIGIDI